MQNRITYTASKTKPAMRHELRAVIRRLALFFKSRSSLAFDPFDPFDPFDSFDPFDPFDPYDPYTVLLTFFWYNYSAG